MKFYLKLHSSIDLLSIFFLIKMSNANPGKKFTMYEKLCGKHYRSWISLIMNDNGSNFIYARYFYNFVGIEIYTCNRFLKINVFPLLHWNVSYRISMRTIFSNIFVIRYSADWFKFSNRWIMDLWFIRLLRNAKNMYLSFCKKKNRYTSFTFLFDFIFGISRDISNELMQEIKLFTNYVHKRNFFSQEKIFQY